MALIAVVISISAYGATASDTVKTATIKVTGITCNGDMPTIKKKLINEDGVEEITFTNPTKAGEVTFTVKYFPSVITEKRIREVMESTPGCDNPEERPYKVKSFNLSVIKQ